MFQEEPEPSQWPSLKATSLSLKYPVWSSGATTHLLFHCISFWYMQYPNQGPSFSWSTYLEKALVSGIKGFKAEFINKSTFHLEKPLAHWRDSAKYFCALDDSVPGTEKGAEHELLVNMRLSVTQEIDLGHFQKDRVFYRHVGQRELNLALLQTWS